MSQILYTYDDPVSLKHLRQARDVLVNGGLLAYPTDVNWACGCLCHHKRALAKLQQLKVAATLGDESPKPISFIFASLAQISEYAELYSQAFRILKKILPGPYTVILNSHKRLPKIIADKRKEIGIRIPRSELLNQLTALLPVPLATISLTSSSPPLADELAYAQLHRPRFGYDIAEAYGREIDLILDLSTELVYRETSVIRLVDGSVELLRLGDDPIDPWLQAMF